MNGLAEIIRKKIKSAPVLGCGCENKPGSLVGLGVFLLALASLSALSCLGFEPKVRLFVAGEIATQDVAADQSLQIEDAQATQVKREQIAQAQPPVFDLSPKPFMDLKKNVEEILDAVSTAGGEELEKARWQVSEKLNTEIGYDTIELWQRPELREVVLDRLLPWLKSLYESGVVSSSGVFLPFKNGILVRELPSKMETVRLDLSDIQDLNGAKEGAEILLKADLKKPFRFRKAVYSLVFPFIIPNLTYNQELTQFRKREVMNAVEPLYYNIAKGEIIVRQGERVGPTQQLKLQALYSHKGDFFRYTEALGFFIISLLFLLVLHMAAQGKGIRMVCQRDWIFFACLLLLYGVMAKLGEIVRLPVVNLPTATRVMFFSYGLPVAGGAGLMALFFSKRLCFFSTLLLSFVAATMMGGGLNLFCFYFIGAIAYVFLIKNTETRSQVMKTCFPLAGTLMLMWFGINLFEFNDLGVMGLGLGVAALNGMVSLLIVLALSPIIESVFGYTSRFRLMELLNLEQPLLQELMVKAPGTYHHSLIVSNMVEAGARAIGANALLAKVAALYHDIGKLKNPHYFIENISNRENRHNKLAPSMSALILISHVKKGVELAREHKLGPVITDLIRQHHGTTLITFFYHKAQEQAEAKGEDPVREEEFRYPGPKPQSKEAGLVLLADAIEASSRTLVDPTPSRIKGHIQSIVRKIYTAGELDESQLTLKDLTLLTETFHRILTGIFHQRIEYPNLEKIKAEKNGKAKEEAAKEEAAKGEAAKEDGKDERESAAADAPKPAYVLDEGP